MYFSRLSKQNSILTWTFIRIITNASCTSSRIKKDDYVYPCCFCGRGRDDLYHFLRCPQCCFLFSLPFSSGIIRHDFFSDCHIARLACFFEVYYFLTRRYGSRLYNLPFCSLCDTISHIRSTIAIKSNIHHIIKFKVINENDIAEFRNKRKSALRAEQLDFAVI